MPHTPAMDGDSSQADAPWPNYALPRGTSVNGYRIEGVLGSGGFGVTYLARDLLGQTFAVKEYFPRQFAIRHGLLVRPAAPEEVPLFQECLERFLREGQALVLLGRAGGGNQGIVRVQTCFQANETCFLVMDFIEGTSLARALERQPGGLEPGRLRALLTDILASLRIVHQAGLLHRDIKPANVLLRDDGKPVLIDFGASRTTVSGESTTYTQIYTSGYAPPEQRLGLPQGRFSDIYAVGALAYRAIGGTPIDALTRHNAREAGRPDPQPAAERVGRGRYPAGLLAAIDAALVIDPNRRPQDSDALLALMSRDEDGPARTPAAASRPARTGRGARLGFAAAALLVAATGVAAWYASGPGFGWIRPNPARTVSRLAPMEPATHAPPPAVAVPSQPGETGTSAGTVERTDQQPPASVEPPRAGPMPPERAAVDAAVTPAPAPERQAMVVAPVQPPPSLLDRVRGAVGSLPCAALSVTGSPEGVRVAGFAVPGQELDRVFGEFRSAGRVRDDITRLPAFACAATELAGQFARQGEARPSPPVAIRIEPRSAGIGARIHIDVQSPLSDVRIDLFQPDGSVRHLPRQGRGPAEWTAAPPAGARLVVALATARPLPLGVRPETEPADAYLTALRSRLQGGGEMPSVDLALLTVRAAEPVARTPVRVKPHADRCANIVNRAQLGETLTDADLALLRSDCRQ